MATRKFLNIEISGETYSDLEAALEEVLHKVREEYLSGHGSNETGDYEFSVTEQLATPITHRWQPLPPRQG